jgi:hypothetical protein
LPRADARGEYVEAFSLITVASLSMSDGSQAGPSAFRSNDPTPIGLCSQFESTASGVLSLRRSGVLTITKNSTRPRSGQRRTLNLHAYCPGKPVDARYRLQRVIHMAVGRQWTMPVIQDGRSVSVKASCRRDWTCNE